MRSSPTWRAMGTKAKARKRFDNLVTTPAPQSPLSGCEFQSREPAPVNEQRFWILHASGQRDRRWPPQPSGYDHAIASRSWLYNEELRVNPRPEGTGAPSDMSAGTPLDRLRTLASQGLLAERYETAAGLLAELAATGRPGDLTRAGAILQRLDADEIVRHNPGTDAVSVAVTGWSSIGGLLAPLAAELARHGWPLRHRVSDFGSYQGIWAIPQVRSTPRSATPCCACSTRTPLSTDSPDLGPLPM